MGFLKDFNYHAPDTLKEAMDTLEKSRNPILIGGGTFVLSYLKKAANAPSDAVGLKKIQELTGIKEEKDSISIGAMTLIANISESELIRNNFSSLAEAALKLGTTPIRNMATIGGNIASRFFWVDLPAVLISLNAKILIVKQGVEKALSVNEFLNLKRDEKLILKSVVLPKKELMTKYFRHTRTMETDIPHFALAFSAEHSGGDLKNIKLVVNTGLSFPIEINVPNLAKDQEALLTGLEKTKLDEYQKQCLIADLSTIKV